MCQARLGSFGEMGPNPNPNIPRHVKRRIFGNIIEAVGPKQYKVVWDDGSTREHFYNSLKKDRSFASLRGEGGNKAGSDAEGLMPRQLESAAPLAPDYHARKADAKAAIKILLGKRRAVKHRNKSIAWTVIEEWDPEEPVLKINTAFGLKLFDSRQYKQSEVLAHLFLRLAFADWQVTLDKMNQAISEANNNTNNNNNNCV